MRDIPGQLSGEFEIFSHENGKRRYGTAIEWFNCRVPVRW
jgi:hypothetical protein